jgi:hypothetical protein
MAAHMIHNNVADIPASNRACFPAATQAGRDNPLRRGVDMPSIATAAVELVTAGQA